MNLMKNNVEKKTALYPEYTSTCYGDHAVIMQQHAAKISTVGAVKLVRGGGKMHRGKYREILKRLKTEAEVHPLACQLP